MAEFVGVFVGAYAIIRGWRLVAELLGASL